MRNYSTARTIFGILEFVAWTAVVIGIIVAIMVASAGGYYTGSAFSLAGAIPGLILSLLGLIGAAIVQNCRAGVDTAEMTGKMLKISEQQLQLSRTSAGYGSVDGTSMNVGATGNKPSATFGAPADPSAGVMAGSDLSTNSAPSGDGSRREPSEAEASIATEQSTTRDIWDVEYRGYIIKRTSNGMIVNGESFVDLPSARQHIDKLAVLAVTDSVAEPNSATIMRKHPSA